MGGCRERRGLRANPKHPQRRGVPAAVARQASSGARTQSPLRLTCRGDRDPTSWCGVARRGQQLAAGWMRLGSRWMKIIVSEGSGSQRRPDADTMSAGLSPVGSTVPRDQAAWRLAIWLGSNRSTRSIFRPCLREADRGCRQQRPPSNVLKPTAERLPRSGDARRSNLDVA